MTIQDGKWVRIDYTLTDDAGDVIDTSEGREPLVYLQGGQQIVPGLERELAGMSAGENKKVVVAPADGYGTYDPNGVFAVPRSALPPGAKVEVGETMLGEGDEGETIVMRVVELKEDVLVVDANHPLAGQTLHFDVTVRDVLEEEPKPLN